MVLGVETSEENFNAGIDIFLAVPTPWRSMTMTRIRRRSFAELLVHGGASLAMPKLQHRESIGRLKKPRGIVALYNHPSRILNPVSGGQCLLNHPTILRRFSWPSLAYRPYVHKGGPKPDSFISASREHREA